MGKLTYSDLVEVDLGKLSTSTEAWKTMVGDLEGLKDKAHSGMRKKSEAAAWEGVNAQVTRNFVRKTAKELEDLHKEARSIWSVLDDAHNDLTVVQRKARRITREAAKDGLHVQDNKDGTVDVIDSQCAPGETQDQKNQDLRVAYTEQINGVVAHASEIDASARRALRKSHGGDPNNAGHARYTSLDEDMVPKATKLAAVGANGSEEQKAKLRHLWESLSPQARAELWRTKNDMLLAAGIMSPQVRQTAVDAGTGEHGAESPGIKDLWTLDKTNLLALGGEFNGMTDAAKHMRHYLDNSGEDLDLPVDRMLSSEDKYRQHIEGEINREMPNWHKQALAEFEKSGGKPVSIPVETKTEDYSFQSDNWYYAVGSARTNASGVLTVEPGSDGQPQINLKYQVNTWDTYNWDAGKKVNVGPIAIPDSEMGRLHAVGLAQEFDMRGSSSIQEVEVKDSAAVDVESGNHGREGDRTDPGR